MCATGIGSAMLEREVEDTITLTVQWENLRTGALGIGVYTASWAAPPSDVHSQQRFFAMSHGGEVTVDQAHRGYTVAADETGFQSCNPLFWKGTPSDGKFAGQLGYGYRSIADFVQAAIAVNSGKARPEDYNGKLATLATTMQVTAILQAGRDSLDDGGRGYRIVYGGPRDGDAEEATRPLRTEPAF